MKLSNIILTERISEYEKAELLQKAWVMLCISGIEGWDIVIMETTSCATPTIVYNIGTLKVLTSILLLIMDIEYRLGSVVLLDRFKVVVYSEKYIRFLEYLEEVSSRILYNTSHRITHSYRNSNTLLISISY